MSTAINRIAEKETRLTNKLLDSVDVGFSNRRGVMTTALVVSDLIALFLAGWGAVSIRAFLGTLTSSLPWLGSLSLSPYYDPGVYIRMLPVLFLFIVAFAWRGLYPTIGLNRVDELRLLVLSISLVSALYAMILFFSQQGLMYSRFVFGVFWVLAIFFVPTARVLTRKSLVHRSRWGVPVGIVGVGQRTSWTADFLATHPNLGFKPLIVFNGAEELDSEVGKLAKVELQLLQDPDSLPILECLDTMIVVQDETPAEALSIIVSQVNSKLPRIMMMPNLPELGSIWVRLVDLGGVLALKIRNNLANPRERLMKRAQDFVFGVLLNLAVLPVLGLIAVAIKLDSRGPLIYGHKRIGLDGRSFSCWKFRTMILNADKKLDTYLMLHPELRAEWEASQKLKDDPRLTRVGKLLRRLSLDELPQLWNVLKGEMSLVGPRPIVDAETTHYGEALALYKGVRPGITGLWQVSGRNNTGYRTRVSLDSYYVRNWSLWLDMYILARTPIAVFSREGAY